jgi:collagenase-like PrtC family protease
MNLSVPFSFQPGLIPKLAAFSQVKDVYAKLPKDDIGGGRSSYTLRPVGFSALRRAVKEAHDHGIAFNYLLNAAGLYGLEQTRWGQKKIRRAVDRLADAGVDGVTVSLPYLLRVVKKTCPAMKVKVGAFALVDSPLKARQWADMGADALCVSAIACNRDFERLARIREAVACELFLIANASCLPGCAWEPTHMHLLSQSSSARDRLGGFCFDYCFLQCSAKRMADSVNYLRAVWIRPEDLGLYQKLGYEHFKLVERSCPPDLLLRRVAAYAAKRFDGNLWELVAPVAQIAQTQDTSLSQRLRMYKTFLRPSFMKISSVLRFKRYAEAVIPSDFGRAASPVYIDNRVLDGFLEVAMKNGCGAAKCAACDVCRAWAARAVFVDEGRRLSAADMAATLDGDCVSGKLW